MPPRIWADGSPTETLAELASALVETQLTRLEPWLRIPALDGNPVISDLFNEWSIWVALGYADLPYDLILTNQLIASTEYYHCSAHTIIRGGISVGGTNFSRSGVYQALRLVEHLSIHEQCRTYPVATW